MRKDSGTPLKMRLDCVELQASSGHARTQPTVQRMEIKFSAVVSFGLLNSNGARNHQD